MENEKALDDWCLEIEKAFEKSPNEKLAATRSVPPVDLAKVRERAMRSPRLPLLDPLPRNIVIATESHPGFSSDLSSWNLTIDQEGNLHRHTLAYERTSEGKSICVLREELFCIGIDEITRLILLAKHIDFPNFDYGDLWILDDAGSSRISVRIDGQIETLEYRVDPIFSDESAEKFFRLWQEIHNLAPFLNT